MIVLTRVFAKVLLGMSGALCLTFFVPPVAAGPYADSAHGNTTYGVLRNWSPQSTPYIQGNCAHCHEQHSSIDGSEPPPVGGAASGFLLLAEGFSGQTDNLTPYDQDDNVCFQCHTTTGSLQSGGITNYNYSTTFGGSMSTGTVESIMAAFNLASYHNLYDIKRFITGAIGSKSFSNFPASSNPCSGCHNVHLARANKRTPGDPNFTALSRPSEHDSLWGDTSPNERMTVYGTAYQPPYYWESTYYFEPDGLSDDIAAQAEKTPDYNTFCIDCHNSTNIIYSTPLGRNLRTFNWSLEMHGGGTAKDDPRDQMNLPYVEASIGTYLLSCLDCHEPHGSANQYLIRNSVNKNTVTLPLDSTDWDELCASCHLPTTELRRFHHAVSSTDFACSDCHVSADRAAGIHDCTNCHYHGSADSYKTF